MEARFLPTLKSILNEALAVLQPPPDLSVSDWSDQYRYLSPESSAEPGRWRTDRAPYQRGIMDAFSDPSVETGVIMSSAQVGKTEIVNNICGFFIHQDPSPMLIVQPTLDMGQAWSKDRLAPMLRDSPSLRGKVREVRSKNSENTILHKKFPGGHLTICGANSPSSLASRPVRVVLNDEVDRYPPSAGTEGDPVDLSWKRATTFWNRKRMMTSTPTVKGFSRIEAAFLNSDQRYYNVPCPHCGEEQVLKWANVHWPEGKPEEALYHCAHCGTAWSESERRSAIRKGRWIATAPFTGTAGFHLWELYSPWSSAARIALSFEEARRLPETLRVWINTCLGETWEEEGDGVDHSPLMDRVEDYGKVVPVDAAVLTAGVDVQDNRLEIEVVAWGEKAESWSIDYKIFPGDPDRDEVWMALLDYVQQTWDSEIGARMKIMGTCIDTGGHKTEAVYKFVRKYGRSNRIFAIRGNPNPGRPFVGRPATQSKHRILVYPLGVDSGKEVLFSRLRIQDPGPGFCHFPDRYEEEYFLQLTAEKVKRKWVKGRPTRYWEQTRARNEALDCRVYAMAAFTILDPSIEKWKIRLEKQAKGLDSLEEKIEQNKEQAKKSPVQEIRESPPGRPAIRNRPSWFRNRG